ncbi:MAG: hemerythrin domain-containing protein [Candidatus Omnitrophica bacterium]|nr:hemerythrin domain-containing protein [Candidatus Omnitrophota bacterium]
MIEHRLIERMIALMDKETQRIEQELVPDKEFIRTAVDFIKTYADRLHHGKEEYILFRDLAKKQLSEEHKRIMDELIKEHAFARENSRKLVDSLDKYLAGEKNAIKMITENMGILAKFYPKHIEKEDKRFFLPAMNYFTKGEQSVMLAEFNDFDRQFIHVTYKTIVSQCEKK